MPLKQAGIPANTAESVYYGASSTKYAQGNVQFYQASQTRQVENFEKCQEKYKIGKEEMSSEMI